MKFNESKYIAVVGFRGAQAQPPEANKAHILSTNHRAHPSLVDYQACRTIKSYRRACLFYLNPNPNRQAKHLY